jgi:hypothetical protein
MRGEYVRLFNCLSKLVLVMVFMSMTSVHAQKSKEQEEPITIARKAPKQADESVIQLEAVIRGNQQQPKVLTIVPWQSPERRNTLPSPVWQQVRQRLQPLERRDFLQEQRLFEKLSKQ